MTEGRVVDIYDQLKHMAVTFQMRPGDRINEMALSKKLGASRTPLREALNRLTAENFFTFRPREGFFCRQLDPKTIFDLFELRQIIECAAVELACERASDMELAEMRARLYASGLEISGLTVAEACARDEVFHQDIAKLSENAVLAAQLMAINEQIRYIRWISMSSGKAKNTKNEHKLIMQAMIDRNAELASDTMSNHIAKRMDQITDAVRLGISNIYLDTTSEVTDRVIEEIYA